MSRSPVTIVIPVWNSWETTRACLDSLRSTLGPRDQVIVVDQGSLDATPAGLRMYQWVETVRFEQNRGYAEAANTGVARARHDLVVLLHNDAVPTGHWLEPLMAALDDASVGAAGPVSNLAGPVQTVLAPPYESLSDMRRFAREWCSAHRGRLSEAEFLDGFCVAMRRPTLVELGGFRNEFGMGSWETADLSLRIRAAGLQLRVAEDSFVHHHGQQTFIANGVDRISERELHRGAFEAAHPGVRLPALVSACIITKDEEQRLPACLASLQGFADEIVVYDTGSTDATVALARAAGATVIEGYWDDDFSRARNEALSHCHGEWIAWLDADEALVTEGRPDHLRELLERTRPDVDAWSVRIRNLTGAGTGAEFSHYASRLFRRARCEWTGRLHEQLGTRKVRGLIRQAELEDAWIDHSGYLDSVMVEKNKAERNLRVAEAEVECADVVDVGYSLCSLGRSLLLSGRCEEGIERLTEALTHTSNGITRRLAVRAIVDGFVTLGQFDEALSWCRRLTAEGTDDNTVNAVESTIRLEQGQHQLALDLLEQVQPEVKDGDGFGTSLSAYAARKATALAGVGREAEAADTMLSVLSEDGVLDAHLGALVDYMMQGGRPLGLLAAAIPADKTTLFLAQILQLRPEPADQVLEACIDSQVDRMAVLATASRLALRLPVDRAMVWSARLRQAGHASACPLVAIAGGPGSAVLRARAAAAAAGAFGDDRAPSLWQTAWADAGREDRAEIEAEASALFPPLLQLAGGAPAAASA